MGIKEKEKSINLAKVQKTNNELIEKNQSLEEKNISQKKTISSQKEEIANKSAAIEKYKKAISRIKEKESPLGNKQNAMTLHERQKSTQNLSEPQSVNVRHGTLLVDNEVEYSSLLQQTIQSLRRKVTQLTISKKLTNCQLNLKPLNFTLLRDQIISNINKEINDKKKNKKKKKVKKQKEEENEQKENENEKDEESEYEWITDDEQEENENDNELNQKLIGLKREKEIAEEMQTKLSSLSSSLDNIRSQPFIVDLTKKKKRNDHLSQEIIGRQMKLRDVHIKYQQIQNQIKKEKNEQENDKEENDQQQTKKLGNVLAQIEIPHSSLKSFGYDRKHRVLMPSQQFDRLQNEFLW